MAGTAHLISINMMGSTTTRHTATGTATTSITGITAPMDGIKTVGESSTMDPTRARYPRDITTMNQQRMAWGDFLIPCFVREPHCHHVPRLCPGPSGAPETGLPERLETETRPVLRLQRAQGPPLGNGRVSSETTAASVRISSLKTAAEQAPCCGSC